MAARRIALLAGTWVGVVLASPAGNVPRSLPVRLQPPGGHPEAAPLFVPALLWGTPGSDRRAPGLTLAWSREPCAFI